MLALLFVLTFQEETQTAALKTGLQLTLPKAWKTADLASKFQLARWTVPPKEAKADPAEIGVYYFGTGGAGTVEANIDRWVGQFKGTTRKDAKIETLEKPMEITIVDLAGTYVAETRPGSGERANKPDTRMLGAIVKTPKGTHYVKLVGPSATVGEWTKEFRSILTEATFSE